MTDEPALFAIVLLPPDPGPVRETLLRDAIAYGEGDELLRKFFACEATERDLASQQAQTVEVANRVADIGTHLMDQVETLAVRADKQRRLDAKRKADEARHDAEEAERAEAAAIRDYLETHPEPAALVDESPQAGGELHPHAPVDKEHLGFEADAGGVALSYGNVPETYVRREAVEDLEEPGIGGVSYPEPNPEDLGGPLKEKQVQQPISTSF
jgi:hypothetical protein